MELSGWVINTKTHFTKNGYTVKKYIDEPLHFIKLPNGKYHTKEYKTFYHAIREVERLLAKEREK